MLFHPLADVNALCCMAAWSGYMEPTSPGAQAKWLTYLTKERFLVHLQLNHVILQLCQLQLAVIRFLPDRVEVVSARQTLFHRKRT